MTLDEYLTSTGSNPTRFAREFGLSRSCTYRYARRERIPPPDVMQRIVVATGGAVTPNDFYDLPAGAHERSSKVAA